MQNEKWIETPVLRGYTLIIVQTSTGCFYLILYLD